VNDQLSNLVGQISLTPYQAIGIPIALLGAVFLSIGAQLQHRGVSKVDGTHLVGAKSGLSLGQLVLLIRRPSWVFGTLLLTLAIVIQLISLVFAPLIVVQPLGVVAMVLTNVINSRVNGIAPDARVRGSIALAVLGIAIFVGFSAVYAFERALSEEQLLFIMWLLAAVIAVVVAAFLIFRQRLRAMFYIVAAGTLFGFVVTITKVLINRWQSNQVDALMILCLAGLIVAALLGGYFVQTAYSVGSPDLVIAGLTVIDPLVAVAIAITVLGEADRFPPFALAGIAVGGALSVIGVVLLARHHPQTLR
jgi:drug/metabolite transporter (DMT)-like permease